MSDRPISTSESLAVIGRAMAYSFRYKFELSVKAATQMTSIFWILFLPWPAKIVVDYIVLGDQAWNTITATPFFFEPLLLLVEPLNPYQTALFMAGLFFFMIILVGAFGIEGAERDSATAPLAEGEDSATRSENQANNMHSLVSGLFGLFEALWHLRITHRLNHQLRSELFHHFESQPITNYQDRSIGDVVYRAMYDTPSISNIIFNLWVGPATSLINLTTTILMMYVVFRGEPTVIWCALVIAPLNFFLVIYFANLVRKHGTLAREAGARTTAMIEEGMSNVMAIQGLGSTDSSRNMFAEASRASYRSFRNLILARILGNYTTTVVGIMMTFVVFYFTASAFIEGRYAPGDWFIIWGYFGAISTSAHYLGRLWLELQENVTGLQRVFAILDSPKEMLDDLDASGTRRELTIEQGIRLEDVSYSYPDGTSALTNVNVEGNLGEMIAFAGPTGSGKTTLAYLIPGLIKPTEGNFFIDGRKLNEEDLSPLRRKVAFVFQEASVFDDTIEGNIRMGRLDASLDEIRIAAELAGAHEFIKDLPQGYQTRPGRSGGKLSMGQKQRLAIARALVSEKPVLILDEPTAALDPQTENTLVSNLRRAREGRLVIVIAHRLSTIRSADRIYFLADGEIMETGNHQALMDKGGNYASFVNLQTSENFNE